MTSFEELEGRLRPTVATGGFSDTVAAVRNRAAELDKAVHLRDRIESWIALAMLPVFGWLAYLVPSPVAKAGALLIATGCVITPLRLRAARGRGTNRAMPVIELLQSERAGMERQRRLLESVLWWYLTPLLGGVALFFAGGGGPLAVKVIGIGATAIVGMVLLVANRRAAERELVPFIRQLDDTISELEGGILAD